MDIQTVIVVVLFLMMIELAWETFGFLVDILGKSEKFLIYGRKYPIPIHHSPMTWLNWRRRLRSATGYQAYLDRADKKPPYTFMAETYELSKRWTVLGLLGSTVGLVGIIYLLFFSGLL